MIALGSDIVDRVCREIAYNISMHDQRLISVHGSTDAFELSKILKGRLESIEDGAVLRSPCQYVTEITIYQKPTVTIVEFFPEGGVEALLEETRVKRLNGEPNEVCILCDPDERFDYQHRARLPDGMGVVGLGELYKLYNPTSSSP